MDEKDAFDEHAPFHDEWAQLKADWAALTPAAQREAWGGYTEALDCGEPGYHPFHPILWTLWELGEPPD